MTKKVFSLILILWLMLAATNCALGTPIQATTTASTPQPGSDQGLYLLVETTGMLTHKRPGWSESLPLSFGVPLDRDDLIEAAADARGVIACADLSLAEIAPGYRGGLPCPQVAPVLTRGGSLVIGPRRGATSATSIPYILSPRHTFIQTAHPLLRWHPSAAGTTYTVRLQGGTLNWQIESTSTELRYPDDAPSLEVGVPYRLKVTDANGRSSDEEDSALDMSFVLLTPEEVAAIQALTAQAERLDLDTRAIQLLESETYAAHGLRADAIALLAALAASPDAQDAPTIYRRLGDLYLEVGLYTEAQAAYEQALDGYRNLKDRAGEAATLIGLGLAYRGSGDDVTAQAQVEQARDLYQGLGDLGGTAQAEDLLAEMTRD